MQRDSPSAFNPSAWTKDELLRAAVEDPKSVPFGALQVVEIRVSHQAGRSPSIAGVCVHVLHALSFAVPQLVIQGVTR